MDSLGTPRGHPEGTPSGTAGMPRRAGLRCPAPLPPRRSEFEGAHRHYLNLTEDALDKGCCL